MMDARDLRIHGIAEFRKAIGHLLSGMEYIHWLNYHGCPPEDAEYEEELGAGVDEFIVWLKERIG